MLEAMFRAVVPDQIRGNDQLRTVLLVLRDRSLEVMLKRQSVSEFRRDVHHVEPEPAVGRVLIRCADVV